MMAFKSSEAILRLRTKAANVAFPRPDCLDSKKLFDSQIGILGLSGFQNYSLSDTSH